MISFLHTFRLKFWVIHRCSWVGKWIQNLLPCNAFLPEIWKMLLELSRYFCQLWELLGLLKRVDEQVFSQRIIDYFLAGEQKHFRLLNKKWNFQSSAIFRETFEIINTNLAAWANASLVNSCIENESILTSARIPFHLLFTRLGFLKTKQSPERAL